jgi:hypothetical protein
MTTRPSDEMSADQIAAEITQTRLRLSQHLVALDREYALRHLFVRATRLAWSGDFDRAKLATTLRRDAAPFGLIALGLFWLASRGGGAGVGGRVLAALTEIEQLARGLTRRRAEPNPPPASPEGDDSLIS